MIKIIDYREDNKWTVYMHISPSGKYYVGITSADVNLRWGKNGKGYKTQMFYNAISKYGWDNIDHEIVADNITREEAESYEIVLIEKLKSNVCGFGYNVASGGLNGVYGITPSNFIDLTNERFGMLRVLHRLPNRIYNDRESAVDWMCICDCGKLIELTSDSLKHTKKSDCGCMIGIRRREIALKSTKTKTVFNLSLKYGVGKTYDNIEFLFDLEDYDKLKDLRVTYSSKRLGACDWGSKSKLPLIKYIYKDPSDSYIFKNFNNLDYRKNNIEFVDMSTFTTYHHLYNNKDNPYYRIKIDNTCKSVVYRLPAFGNGYAFKTLESAITQRNKLLKEKHEDNELLSELVALFYCNKKEVLL